MQVNLHTGDDDYLCLYSDHEVLVASDGSFEIGGLRAASGQVIAMCDGWVSKLVPPRTPQESRMQMSANVTGTDRNRSLARAQKRERLAQCVDVAAGQDLVIEMEPVGELEVRVTDEEGAPLAGVPISAWPYVLWTGVGSIVFPWRDWNAISDANGIGRIANLPPATTFVGIEASAHQLRRVDRNTHPKAAVESGKSTRLELVLEKIH
ncbi:MAG: carboxypeptidase-like regulatory domain-containing protein [Planctomycetota bacterium]